jgi:O-antigen ligase
LRQNIGSAVIAVYLLLCIVLGGSAQGVWGLLALELLGIGLITASALSPIAKCPDSSLSPTVFIGATLLLVLLQLIPLPPDYWAALPGRSAITAGFNSLGIPPPALPISETPDLSLVTLFASIPALAVFIGVATLNPAPRWIAASIVAGTVISVFLGQIQVAGGPTSWAYLYRITNTGAVGFFANRNHLGTLLVVTIPMTAALIATARPDRRRSSTAFYGAAAAVLVVLLGGIVLNGSLAVIALVLPVLLASVSLLPVSSTWRRITLPLSVLVLAAGVMVIAIDPIATAEIDSGATVSFSTRTEIWERTVNAVADNFPVGTGLGSFQQVYPQFEDPAQVTPSYVNHAHNDYLELALELGLPGMVLMLAFFAWWMVTSIKIWVSHFSSPFARAATISTAAVLAHSVVDFPLRTAAISSIFAACLAMMTQNPLRSSTQKRGELRPMRHVKLG